MEEKWKVDKITQLVQALATGAIFPEQAYPVSYSTHNVINIDSSPDQSSRYWTPVYTIEDSPLKYSPLYHRQILSPGDLVGLTQVSNHDYSDMPPMLGDHQPYSHDDGLVPSMSCEGEGLRLLKQNLQTVGCDSVTNCHNHNFQLFIFAVCLFFH